METGYLVAGLVGAICAWLATYVFLHRRYVFQMANLEDQSRDLLTQKHQLQLENSTLTVRLIEREKSMLEKTQSLEAIERQLRESFASISAETMKASTDQFLELASARIGAWQHQAEGRQQVRERHMSDLVKPLQESLEKVDSKILSLEKERIGAYQGVKQQVQSLLEVQLELRKETSNLVRALRMPSARGRWGEIQLRRVVEMAGMIEYCDFFEQKSYRSGEDDRLLRPDVTIRLPGGKSVVVDAKTPLFAYLDAMEAKDESARAALLMRHAEQVRKHVQDLSQKAYWDQFTDAPDFVVLFLPGEPFFSAALEYDPTLIEYGSDSRVILATPTTLIALLRAIAYGWRQESLAENAREVCELGKSLFNRICDMTGHFQDVGDKLRKSVSAYNKTVASLDSRVLVAARRFKDLQVATSDKDIAKLPQIVEDPVRIEAPEEAL